MFYKIILIIFKPIMWLIFRPKVKGKENLKKVNHTGYILISNHNSYRDPVVLGLTIGYRKMQFMAKKELFHGLFGVLISLLGAFPVSRAGSDTKAIRKAMDVVKQGEVCLVFPEGTRSKSGEVLPFQKGVALIAMQCNVPIIPAYIEPGWRNGRVHISYGEPVNMAEFEQISNKRARMDGIAERLHREVLTLEEGRTF